MGMSVAISMESVSARMTVGPNTMATLVANILFTWPISTTLGVGHRMERGEGEGEGGGRREGRTGQGREGEVEENKVGGETTCKSTLLYHHSIRWSYMATPVGRKATTQI